MPPDREELERAGRFGRVVFRRYERDLTYSTREYLDLLLSYSNHRALEPDARRELLTCIAQLIDDGFGGRVASAT